MKLEPLDSQIQTGYMINRAVLKGTKYLTQAIECLDQALIDTQEQGLDVGNIDLGTAKKKLYRSLAGLQEAEEAHNILANILCDLGYRDITDKDFKNFGSGGRR